MSLLTLFQGGGGGSSPQTLDATLVTALVGVPQAEVQPGAASIDATLATALGKVPQASIDAGVVAVMYAWLRRDDIRRGRATLLRM